MCTCVSRFQQSPAGQSGERGGVFATHSGEETQAEITSLEGPRAHLDCSVALELLPQATTGPWELPEAFGFY